MQKRVLLIEDDPFLIDVYETKLKKSGYKVEVVEKGDLAFEKIKSTNPNLILLDIVLPKMDGWEILKKIKKEEETKNCKVVILSNLGQKEEVDKGLKMGAEKYFIKAHYTPEEIIKKIDKLLNGQL